MFKDTIITLKQYIHLGQTQPRRAITRFSLLLLDPKKGYSDD